MKINPVSEKITNNQKGIAFLLPVAVVLLLFMAGMAWYDMFSSMGFFQDKAEITRQRELTEL